MGATHIISHREPLDEQLQQKAGIESVDYIFICYNTNGYMETAVQLAAPKAKIGSIVEITDKLDGMHDSMAFMKQLSFHWELMLSKSKLEYKSESQGAVLDKAAKLYDASVPKSTMTESHVLSAANLAKRAAKRSARLVWRFRRIFSDRSWVSFFRTSQSGVREFSQAMFPWRINRVHTHRLRLNSLTIKYLYKFCVWK
jgi:hypothetical protein